MRLSTCRMETPDEHAGFDGRVRAGVVDHTRSRQHRRAQRGRTPRSWREPALCGRRDARFRRAVPADRPRHARRARALADADHGDPVVGYRVPALPRVAARARRRPAAGRPACSGRGRPVGGRRRRDAVAQPEGVARLCGGDGRLCGRRRPRTGVAVRGAVSGDLLCVDRMLGVRGRRAAGTARERAPDAACSTARWRCCSPAARCICSTCSGGASLHAAARR